MSFQMLGEDEQMLWLRLDFSDSVSCPMSRTVIRLMEELYIWSDISLSWPHLKRTDGEEEWPRGNVSWPPLVLTSHPGEAVFCSKDSIAVWSLWLLPLSVQFRLHQSSADPCHSRHPTQRQQPEFNCEWHFIHKFILTEGGRGFSNTVAEIGELFDVGKRNLEPCC